MSGLIYTGIGSRLITDEVQSTMTFIARCLAKHSYTLRSGAADGADAAFEAGALKKEIYLPWRGFNKHSSNYYVLNEKAYQVASENHPVWVKLTPAAKKLHGRNAYQVLGYDLDAPSDFLICWTQDGCESHIERTYRTGGTGTAISIASKNNIPIFNLANSGCYQRLQTFLKHQDVFLPDFNTV